MEELKKAKLLEITDVGSGNFQKYLEWDHNAWKEGLELLKSILEISELMMSHEVVVKCFDLANKPKSILNYRYILPADMLFRINEFRRVSNGHFDSLAEDQAKSEISLDDISGGYCPCCIDSKLEPNGDDSVFCPKCNASWIIPEDKR